MASNLYNPGLEKLLNQSIDFIADDIQILIVSDTYTFSKSHEFVSDVNASEVTNNVGTGYQRLSLSNKQIALDAVDDRVYYDADNPEYQNIQTNETMAMAIIFKQVTSDADSPVIAAIDFPNITTNGSGVELRVNSEGLFEVNNNIV